MIGNYRSFDVGPDPFGRTWSVVFLWQQNGISIRHADTVDCKFRLTQGGESQEKVIALPHPALLEVTKELALQYQVSGDSEQAKAMLAEVAILNKTLLKDN